MSPPRYRAPLVKFVFKVGARPWFIALMRHIMVPADRFLLKRSNGRVAVGNSLGVDSLLLTTTGKRSGQPRTTPLWYHHHGDAFAVVASNFGRPRHPAWSDNLLAAPNATVTVADQTIPVTARLLDGDEHADVWRVFVEFGPRYQDYLDASGRVFRIFALERAEVPR